MQESSSLPSSSSGPSSNRGGKKPSSADFMFGTTLGEGAYARVVHARMKDTGMEYAVKIMEKRFIKKEKKVKFVMMERKVFSKVSHDRIVKLFFTFQDENYLYMVMELCRGGELLDVITKKHQEQVALGLKDRACSLDIVRFFIAEIVVALQYLHSSGVIHRDLKPENILLCESGHIKITDFGTAKDETEEHKHNTFCGTAEFVSPEVLRDHEASRGCDLWALACMIFQMLVGRPMFRAENEYLTFQQILNHPAEEFRYPEGFPEVASDLIDKILIQDPKDRLGTGLEEDGNGYEALKSHSFFEGINWDTIGSEVSPYIPHVAKLPPTDNDGATEDWLFAGVATELQVSSGLVAEPLIECRTSGDSVCAPVDVLEVARQKAAAPPPPVVRTSSLWNRFLLDDELIKMCGLISKRKGLFSKKRQLILTSMPRLIYIDPTRMKQKGEIPWSKNLYVQSKSTTAFDVVTPNRVYHLNDLVNGSRKWIDAINSVLVRAI
uniref:non-specific serine/threonine protein kinase n=1 Tax=Albugo laibachii Nc14 TaxID=890382 RepID=F0W8Q4_9STRA|nr:3phosphoinositidedependent protein kinase putative [Albugo laibachii Nc14]|eukprot:CCA17511.1 3phosphoinositidedependent protein kinase putative [Albugo laibachii Nc14]